MLHFQIILSRKKSRQFGRKSIDCKTDELTQSRSALFQEKLELDPSDPLYRQFAKIFETFRIAEDDEVSFFVGLFSIKMLLPLKLKS